MLWEKPVELSLALLGVVSGLLSITRLAAALDYRTPGRRIKAIDKSLWFFVGGNGTVLLLWGILGDDYWPWFVIPLCVTFILMYLFGFFNRPKKPR